MIIFQSRRATQYQCGTDTLTPRKDKDVHPEWPLGDCSRQAVLTGAGSVGKLLVSRFIFLI